MKINTPFMSALFSQVTVALNAESKVKLGLWACACMTVYTLMLCSFARASGFRHASMLECPYVYMDRMLVFLCY